MSRRKREVAQVDLKVFECIPNLREALRSVGLELLIRPLGPSVPASAPPFPTVALGQTTTAQPPAMPVVVLDTPERREFQATHAGEVDAAVQAEISRGAPALTPPKPLAQMPAGQRRAVERGFLDANMRTQKMQQFRKPAQPGEQGKDVVVNEEPLDNLGTST